MVNKTRYFEHFLDKRFLPLYYKHKAYRVFSIQVLAYSRRARQLQLRDSGTHSHRLNNGVTPTHFRRRRNDRRSSCEIYIFLSILFLMNHFKPSDYMYALGSIWFSLQVYSFPVSGEARDLDEEKCIAKVGRFCHSSANNHGLLLLFRGEVLCDLPGYSAGLRSNFNSVSG